MTYTDLEYLQKRPDCSSGCIVAKSSLTAENCLSVFRTLLVSSVVVETGDHKLMAPSVSRRWREKMIFFDRIVTSRDVLISLSRLS